jgi:hypothetical protein
MTPEFATGIVQRVGEAIRGGTPQAREAFGTATSCYLAGGEPCDDPLALQAVTSAAKRNGMFTQVVSWGYWILDAKRAEVCLDALKTATDMLIISVSARRARTAGVSHVDALVRTGRERELPCSIQLILDDGDRWPTDLVRLPSLSEDSMLIQVVPAISEYSSPADDSALALDRLPPTRCKELFGFIVMPAGEVYPCYPMIGFESMRLGNLRTDSVEEILMAALRRPDLRHFARCGPGELLTHATSSGKGDLLPTSFVDQCHFHRKFMNNPTLAELAGTWRPAAHSALI